MKGLTLSAVEWMMDLLIHTNGQTTTLEVKNALREIGYYAEQNAISTMMNELYEANNEDVKLYNCDNSGEYKIYSYTDIITSQVPTAVDVVIEDEDEDEDNLDVDTFTVGNTTMDIVSSNSVLDKYRKSVGNTTNTSTSLSRDPEFIFYTEKHAKNSGVDSKSWVVFHANGNKEIQIYNKDLTRDLVRSRYASIMKVKIQDVRAKRFANY